MSRHTVVQSHLEVLMRAYLEVDELKVAEDGCVFVQGESAVYAARVRRDRNEPHIEVRSPVITGIGADPGLFEALNAINVTLSHCRAFGEAGTVFVAGELLGASADENALECLCLEVVTVAQEKGPELVDIFGGHLYTPDDVED